MTAELVLEIHYTLFETEMGLKGFVDVGKLDGALARIDNWVLYENTDNIFDLAALYAVVLAKAHAFSDGNKRTAMIIMLTYLDLQGIEILPDQHLDDVMVSVASGELDFITLSNLLQKLIKES